MTTFDTKKSCLCKPTRIPDRYSNRYNTGPNANFRAYAPNDRFSSKNVLFPGDITVIPEEIYISTESEYSIVTENGIYLVAEY